MRHQRYHERFSHADLTRMPPSAPAPRSNSRQLQASVIRPERFASDELLHERALRGDTAARQAIYDRHAPHLRRVLFRTLGTQQDLGDLLHDAFAEAFASLQRLRDPSSLRSWLTHIAVNVARGRLRYRKRRRWLSFSAPEDVPELETAQVKLDDVRAVRAVYRILSGLPIEERLCFSLHHVEQMTIGEVASACGASPSTVKRRLRRARTAFLERAQDCEELRLWLDRGAL